MSPHIIYVNYFYCINTYIGDKLGGYIQALNIAIYFVVLISIFIIEISMNFNGYSIEVYMYTEDV